MLKISRYISKIKMIYFIIFTLIKKIISLNLMNYRLVNVEYVNKLENENKELTLKAQLQEKTISMKSNEIKSKDASISLLLRQINDNIEFERNIMLTKFNVESLYEKFKTRSNEFNGYLLIIDKNLRTFNNKYYNTNIILGITIASLLLNILI